MQVALLVDGVNRAKQRQQAADPDLVDDLRAQLMQLRQRGATVKGSTHIGGVVLHPEAQHVQQIRVVLPE
uniref:Uncharacterized protein n=1 Tax=Raoultella ornithinolytica TaxID=54291 RepID=A0A0M3STI1_RAOOR|nr:hypothetical protein [Raoultella ornithinolytica]